MQSSQVNVRSLFSSAVLLVGFTTVLADGYDPVIDNFRLDQNDQLVIDRGGPVDRLGDVNGDTLEDIVVGGGVAAVRVIFGPTRGNNGVLNGQQLDGISGFVIANDSVNDSLVAGVGDVNGDGLNDVGVASLSGTRVVYGSNTPFPRTLEVESLDGSNGFAFTSPATDIKRAGDINGDGLDDFVVGNANASPNGLTGAGVSYVIFGDESGFPASFSISALNGSNGFAVIGISAEDRTGRAVAGAGDFNNDGFDDVLIGAPYQTTDGKAEAGAAYLLFGGTSFPPALSLADISSGNGLVFKGSDIQDLAGFAVGPAGDLNHDGIDDIAIGSPGKGPFGVPSAYPGEAYVLFGGNFAGVDTVVENDLNGVNGLVLRGIRGGVVPIEENQPIWGDMAGNDLDAAGDFNGDGIDDLMIGAPHSIITPQRKGVGQVYFVFGSVSAFPERMRLSDLDGANGFRINGTGTTDYYAVSVAGAGDFNVDGRDDVMMGASGQGETYVFYGRETGNPRVPPPSAAEQGAVSIGFPAAALSLGLDAEPLAFNERADPTGPDPLPPGTPTDPTDPMTPGYTAPHPLNTQPVPRPADDTDGAIDDGVTAPPVEEDDADADADADADGDGDGDGDGLQGTSTAEPSKSGGGIGLWLPFILLIGWLNQNLRHRRPFIGGE